MRRTWAAVCGVAIGLGSGTGAPVRAQEPAEAWDMEAELGFTGASGNTSFAVLRTAFTATHLRTDLAEFELSALYRYGENDGELIARDWRAGLKFDLWPQDTWSPFVFATATGDAVRQLDLRSEGGLGVKYTFWDGESGDASISMAAMYGVERLVQIEVTDSYRWSWRVKGEKALGGTELQHTTFYQPTFGSARDFIVESISSISTDLVGELDLGLEYELLHDSRPPPDVERSDHRFAVVFSYSF